jgi:hypothetical protein
VSGHARIGKGTAHRGARAHERGIGEVRALPQDAPEALVEDARGPSGLDDADLGQAEQEVAQGRRVEDAGVVDGDGRQVSVP